MIKLGSTIGVFGSGQLGRMLAVEARKMGFRFITFSPDSDSPAGQIADEEIVASYDDLCEVKRFAKSVDIVTFEFENIPMAAIEAASKFAPIFPHADILNIAQNRLREKRFLERKGIPIAKYRAVRTPIELQIAADEIGFPCVLKRAGFGYDGKGQRRIKSAEDVEIAAREINDVESVLEEFIDFEKEISVVCARNAAGEFADYGAIENVHKNHVLDTSFTPGNVSDSIRSEAVGITREIAEVQGYVGIICVEFFVTRAGDLLVNEFAPRPHNSGHVTFESSCATSQFEQHLRAICGMPLGDTTFENPVAIANLLGELWENGEPNWSLIAEDEGVSIHLYGKRNAKRGRKMGHLIAVNESVDKALKVVRDTRNMLRG